MTPFDDHELIDWLQSEIAERESEISAPDGIGDQARRAARRRTATRAVSAGVPMIAAAGVATVLATSSGSGATPASASSASGPNAGGAALSAPTGPVQAQDTAYIVKRVKAKIAADNEAGLVTHHYTNFGSRLTSDGSLVGAGALSSESYEYQASDGTGYLRSRTYAQDGSLTSIGIDVDHPGANGAGQNTLTSIDPATHTYRVRTVDYPATPDGPYAAVGVGSSSSQVQQALQSGQVTREGTTTVNGTQAITLSVPVPGHPSERFVVDVDAQTYQPLRSMDDLADGQNGVYVTDWLPATAANIAMAKDDSIPAGYTKSGF